MNRKIIAVLVVVSLCSMGYWQTGRSQDSMSKKPNFIFPIEIPPVPKKPDNLIVPAIPSDKEAKAKPVPTILQVQQVFRDFRKLYGYGRITCAGQFAIPMSTLQHCQFAIKENKPLPKTPFEAIKFNAPRVAGDIVLSHTKPHLRPPAFLPGKPREQSLEELKQLAKECWDNVNTSFSWTVLNNEDLAKKVFTEFDRFKGYDKVTRIDMSWFIFNICVESVKQNHPLPTSGWEAMSRNYNPDMPMDSFTVMRMLNNTLDPRLKAPSPFAPLAIDCINKLKEPFFWSNP